MNIDIISVVPDLMRSFISHSMIDIARKKGLLSINLIDLREYGIGRYKQLDDYPFGGDAGMVLKCEPLSKCIEDVKKKREYDHIVYLTPDGQKYNQAIANRLSTYDNLLLICGHYKGIDQRIRDKYVSLEISIGDYVLSGGEIPACVLVDSIGRLIPGVLNDETSALSDSFQDGLLSYPVYTRPREWNGMIVPEVLLSGNHKDIENWKQEQSEKITKEKRPDLLS